MRLTPIRRSLAVLALGLLTVNAMADSGPTESSTEMKAASLLPASIVSGVHSQVLDPVENDGYLNVYRLKSKFGEMKVVSTATLYKRVHEFDMIAQMDQLSASDQFTNAVGAAANKTLDGAVNLVTNPIETTEKAVSGIGKLFGSFGRAISGKNAPSDGNKLAEISGFDKTERAYAAKFSVDPYSRNPYLQQTLRNISKAGFLGGTLTSLGLGAVGGGFITATSTTQNLGNMLTSKSPQEVANANAATLQSMGVSEDLSDLFMGNQSFTVTERAAIVLSLDSMAKTKGREAFIKFSVLTHDPDVAAFRSRQAVMYANYDQKVARVSELRFLGQFAAGILQDNSILVMAPVDHLLWTKEISSYIDGVNQTIQNQDNLAKQLWLAGTASPLALKNLQSAGWKVQQKVDDKWK